jgi:hypothetical protein
MDINAQTNELDGLPAHADAGPSSADRWIECPASVVLGRGKKRKATFYTREGSAAHRIGELELTGHDTRNIKEIEIEGEAIEITQEMREHVGVYVTVGEALRENADIFRVEERGDLSWLYAPQHMPEPIFGTSDLVAYTAAERILRVVDFKYGQGYAVDPKDNPQLMIYALQQLGKFTSDFPIKIQLVVVQPRAGDEPVRKHTMLLSELMKWSKEILEPAIQRIADGDTTETPGDWCRWCPRAAECGALHSRALEVAQMTFKPQPPAPQDLTPEEISSIMAQAELISSWISKVRLHAEEILHQGGTVPGWKLVQKRATRKWSDALAAERHLIEELAIPELEVLTEPELKSVAQVEKVLKAYDVKLTELEHLIVKESSGLTLAKADDKRGEVVSPSPIAAFKPQLVAFDS